LTQRSIAIVDTVALGAVDALPARVAHTARLHIGADTVAAARILALGL